MTLSQAAPASTVLPLPTSGHWDWEVVFGRRAHVVLEVGSGKGLFLATAAAQLPDRDFLGVEIRRKRVEKIAGKIGRLPNARVAEGDVRVILSAVRPGSLEACWVNFPDPWPKRAHAHRRIFANPGFIVGVAKVLKPGGEFLIATDVGWYAGEILLACSGCPDLENPWRLRPAPRPEGYPVSIHEAKFRSWGRPIYFLRFRRKEDPR